MFSAEKAFATLANLAEWRGVTVQDDPGLPSHILGQYWSGYKLITVKPTASARDRLWTLAHEIGHHLHEHTGDMVFREHAEMQAETFAQWALALGWHILPTKASREHVNAHYYPGCRRPAVWGRLQAQARELATSFLGDLAQPLPRDLDLWQQVSYLEHARIAPTTNVRAS